jgi:ABC-2 type transport system permease protein
MTNILAPVRRVSESRELLWNLTLRELRTKYRRSVLGWSWSMLNPLATVAIYTFIFSVVFEAEPPVGGSSGLKVYALYLLCGTLPWGFHVLITNLGMTSLVTNAALVRKVAFPREILVFSNALHALTQHGIEMSLLAVALLVAGGHFLPFLPLIALYMVLLGTFSCGIGLALAALYVYFRDMSYLWTIVIQMWFFTTPIVYTEDRLSGLNETARAILRWNPMAVFIRGFRTMLYHGQMVDVGNLVACTSFAAGSLVLGWATFVRLSRRFAEEL